MDHEPDDPDASKQPPYLVGFLYNGYYFRKKRERPATIALYTRDLYFPIPKILAASHMARFRIASILAHEVGHHVIETRGYVSQTKIKRRFPKYAPVDPEKEATADEYARTVISRMLNSTSYRLGALLARMLSYYLFEIGNWWAWKGNFKRAARLEFRAYFMDPENSDAWQSYLLDKQALLKTPSALTDAERLWIYHRRVKSDAPKELT